MTAPASPTEQFTLILPGIVAELQVTGATGTEAMNALYRFDVYALVSANPGFARRAIETPATLSMHFDGETARAVHGIVGTCQATGQEAGRAAVFLMRIVPRMHRLRCAARAASSRTRPPAISSSKFSRSRACLAGGTSRGRSPAAPTASSTTRPTTIS